VTHFAGNTSQAVRAKRRFVGYLPTDCVPGVRAQGYVRPITCLLQLWRREVLRLDLSGLVLRVYLQRG